MSPLVCTHLLSGKETEQQLDLLSQYISFSPVWLKTNKNTSSSHLCICIYMFMLCHFRQISNGFSSLFSLRTLASSAHFPSQPIPYETAHLSFQVRDQLECPVFSVSISSFCAHTHSRLPENCFHEKYVQHEISSKFLGDTIHYTVAHKYFPQLIYIVDKISSILFVTFYPNQMFL